MEEGGRRGRAEEDDDKLQLRSVSLSFEGDVPTFEGLSNLRTVQMMVNAFSRVSRRSFAGIAERDVVIDLASQGSTVILGAR